MMFANEKGIIPVIVVVAIAIGACSIALGILAYMITHAFSAILVCLGLGLILGMFVLPNLSVIANWYLKVKGEFSKVQRMGEK